MIWFCAIILVVVVPNSINQPIPVWPQMYLCNSWIRCSHVTLGIFTGWMLNRPNSCPLLKVAISSKPLRCLCSTSEQFLFKLFTVLSPTVHPFSWFLVCKGPFIFIKSWHWGIKCGFVDMMDGFIHLRGLSSSVSEPDHRQWREHWQKKKSTVLITHITRGVVFLFQLAHCISYGINVSSGCP